MLRYKSGCTGEEINLSKGNIRAHIKTAGLYDYEWTPEEIESILGSKVQGFRKKAVKYKILIDYLGNEEERAKAAENLFEAVEADVMARTPGTLFFKEFYTKCYIIGSKYEDSKNSRGVRKEATIYVPKQSWIAETKYYFKITDVISTDNRKYPLKYPNRYANNLNDAYVINPHFSEANFLLRIYGPVTNPLVNIGEHPYLVNVKLEDGEYLEINSIEKTVIKTMTQGEKVSIFHNRAKGKQSVFKKIPHGRQGVTWPGTFNFDLIIYEERSQPKWNKYLQN